jgi:ribonuclease G
MYDPDDAVAKLDGYIISIAGAAGQVGEKRMVRIDEVGRTAASALLLDDEGNVVAPEPKPPVRRTRTRRRSPAKAAAKSNGNGAAPEHAAEISGVELIEPIDGVEIDAVAEALVGAAREGEDHDMGAADEDGVQSKPRRRGRRGGRRRSAAKEPAGTE